MVASLTLYLPGLDLQSDQARWLRRGSVHTINAALWPLAHQWLLTAPPSRLFSLAEAQARYEGVWQQGEWLLLEPLHLTVDLAHVYHLQGNALVLTADESAALQASLQSHLAEYALTLVVSASGSWYLHSTQALEIETVAPHVFLGQSIRRYLPSGPRQAFWQRLLTEIQMLLATHPVNLQRRKRGEPTVDAWWMWGEGASLSGLTPAQATRVRKVVSSDKELLGLAQALGISTEHIAWETCCTHLHPDKLPLESSVWSFAQATPDAVSTLAALHQALKQGVIETLVLYPNQHQCFSLRRQDLAPWKVWKLFSFS